MLANPTLDMRNANGTLVFTNNDWQDNPEQAAIIAALGLAPSNAFEAAIAATLPPDLYTVLLAGLNKGTGNGLVEVYDLANGTHSRRRHLESRRPRRRRRPRPQGCRHRRRHPGCRPRPRRHRRQVRRQRLRAGRAWRTSMRSSSLPAGWVATNDQGPPPLWAISTTSSDTAPNNAFVSDTAVISDKRLDSRAIAISSAAAQISFRNNYDFEFSDGTYWDGGVLEASINGGPFVDITHPSVGGSFVSGAYNGTIDSTADNPISSQPAWASSSGGYINSMINLGAALQGQSIVLRFRMGTDQAIGGPGWHVDTLMSRAERVLVA